MRARLSILYLLHFAIWGAYLTSLGQFLGRGGLGGDIAWFYAAVGLVSVLTPSLFGMLSDRMLRPDRLLSLCYLLSSAAMLGLWRYGSLHPQLEFFPTFGLYILFLSFYLPCMALANVITFREIESSGKSIADIFPGIRIWGTVGFILAMWFVNSAYWHEGQLAFTFSDASSFSRMRFQYNSMQLLCSGLLALGAFVYSFFLPSASSERGSVNSNSARPPFSEIFRSVISRREMTVFLLFVALTGACMQISNGFVTPYITHYSGLPAYSDSFASSNATLLFSLSQISEALCVLLVGVCLRRLGFSRVYALGLLAWSLRFLALGFGNPGDGLWMLVGSMLVYGVAFNFITIAGHMHIQSIAPARVKGLAQGLMMLMSNGIGATVGTLCAGSIVNHWCQWQMAGTPPVRLFMGEWQTPWLIFALYALTILLLWVTYTLTQKSFHPPHR
ncbi:MAG: MFS transporter [Duncaniella sp.]|nr:MFS transporter [Duncaniella sp.]